MNRVCPGHVIHSTSGVPLTRPGDPVCSSSVQGNGSKAARHQHT
ncbi:hypothetical protein ACFFX0_24595 [Citricoccus parietis]|uniref:Uncharacterized protein n=1 Tax=Citricoccus parietis TaxID=592307 RepID=A0ABV5G5I2_9MICC